MSEKKYYVFQKSLNCKKIAFQLVRCKFMSRDVKFVPIKTRSGRYENSFSELTKKELAEIMEGALYRKPFLGETGIQPEWINPLVELVPVEGEDVSN